MKRASECRSVAHRALVLPAMAGVFALAACAGSGGAASSSPSATAGSPLASPTTAASPEPVSQWKPGTASLAQTLAVARRWTAALHAETIPGARLYSASSTFDSWSGNTHVKGAAAIEKTYRDAAPSLGWSKKRHTLAAPGVFVDEGVLQDFSIVVLSPPSTPALDLLAVDGDKVAHEEIFLDTSSYSTKAPVTYCTSTPRPSDTATVAAKVGAAVGDAFATADQGAMQALVAPNVLFYDTSQARGVRGWDGLLAWWAKVPQVTLENRAPIAGPGWVLLRWTVRLAASTGVELAMPGATMMEVRDGKVVRMTLYYDSKVLKLQT